MDWREGSRMFDHDEGEVLLLLQHEAWRSERGLLP
jgi:hypothetical protein